MADLEHALRRLGEDSDLLDEFLANAEDVASRLDLSEADQKALVKGEVPLPNDPEAAAGLKSAVLRTFGDKCPARMKTL